MDFITPDEYLPKLHKGIDYSKYGIGLIGCGNIANQAHLPAYKKMGLNVVACCDVNESAAKSTAEKFDIPFWTTDVDRLVENEKVQIFDLAIHPHVRTDVLRAIGKTPRPVLCQKPLAVNLSEAYTLGRLAKELNITLGINQQARFAPEHKAIDLLLSRGIVGEIYAIQHHMRSFQDQQGWWWTTMRNFNIVDHGIHYVDLCRHWSKFATQSDSWTRLQCTTAMLPGQNSVDPLIYSANIEFGAVGGRNHLMANLYFNNIVRANSSHHYNWWIDGTEGSIRGSHDRLQISLASEPNTWREVKIKGSWFPDGFASSMIDFITRVAQGKTPGVTVEDNYDTIAMTTAMVMSSELGRVVERDEVFQLYN